ncbi:U32 family peptidase [Methanobrevibacter filiformis]|nr:U32 family peptidase [Methanobrevibacter filiformis]
MVMELLAPAGSYDVFKIAVNLGADAVYLAGEKFGARAYAENFSVEEIRKSVEYAHLNNTKVFITVNTLINDFEVVTLLKYLFKLYKIGVDAVIVQDFGVLKLIKSVFPKMKIHASTQMALNNYYSAIWAYENGVSRIIFPRELSVDEIHNIKLKLKENNIDMELEVFSHGALCYSISGNCYISSYNNGRSGNRGACTQPCRREYTLKYKGHNIDKGYLLSTHDINVSDDLDKLIGCGINSIKLEGRMKSEDYVGTIVNSYRNLLDEKEGRFREDLNLVFNRKFTKGYLLNQNPEDVMGRESSGHTGFYIGKIIAILDEEEITDKYTKKSKNRNIMKDDNNNKYNNKNDKNNNKNKTNKKSSSSKNPKDKKNEKYNETDRHIKTNKRIKIAKENLVEIEKGDGIAFKMGKKIKGIYLDEILEQNDEYLIFNTTRNVREGDEVFISYSQSIHSYLKEYKKEHIQSKIAISLDITLDNNLYPRVKSKFNLNNTNFEFSYTSPFPFEKAIKNPIEINEIKKQLSKTGETPFFIDHMDMENFSDNLFIPISKLNKIRRGILDRATKILLNYYKVDKTQIKNAEINLNNFIKEYNSGNLENTVPSTNNKLGVSVFVDNPNLIEIASEYSIAKIYFDPSYLYSNPNDYFENIKDLLIEGSWKAAGIELVWVLPTFISEQEIHKAVEVFNDLKNQGIHLSIMSDVTGISDLFNTKIYGNHNLNIWNSYSCENLKESGFNSLILSSELSYDEIKELNSKLVRNGVNLDLELIVHGNLEVIISNDDFSNLTSGKDLVMSDNSEYVILEDKKRKKFKYKVLFDFNKKSHFRNKDCLCLMEELGMIKNLGLSSIILDCRFSNESYSSQIISLYLEGLKDTNKKALHSLKKEIYSLTHSYLSKGNFLEGRIHEKD